MSNKVGNNGPKLPGALPGTGLSQVANDAVEAMTSSFGEVLDSFKINIASNPKMKTAEITLPSELYSESVEWASKRGLSPNAVNEIIYQVLTDKIIDPESEKPLTREQFLEKHYKLFFHGDLSTKLNDWMEKDPAGQKWFKANEKRIIDNFKNRFNSSSGMFMISILSLMGLGEIANAAGIKDPTLQLAFVLSAISPITKGANFANSYIKGAKTFKSSGLLFASPATAAEKTLKPFAWYKPFKFFEAKIISVEKNVAYINGKNFPIEKGVSVPVQNGKVALTIDGHPVQIAAKEGKKVWGRSLSVPEGRVEIKIVAGGKGAKYFIKGLLDHVFPKGETKLIRAGKSFVGILKLPTHIYYMFTNMGCGIATQTLWNETIGELIPDDFMGGLPKHFFSIAALFAPEIAISLANKTWKSRIYTITSNPAWKILGRLLILDIAALGAMSLAYGIFGDQNSSSYHIGTHMRAATDNVGLVKHWPDWLPGKTYLGIFFGALLVKEREKIEKVDALTTSSFRSIIKGHFLEALEPTPSGKAWVSFAEKGGFIKPNLNVFKTFGQMRINNPKEYRNVIQALQLLAGYSGMADNKMFDEWFDIDWITSKKVEDFNKAVQEGKWDDKELLDPDHEAKLLSWLYLNSTGFECGEMSEDDCNAYFTNLSFDKYKSRMQTKFARAWINEKLKLLSYLYSAQETVKYLEFTYKTLAKMGINPGQQEGPKWAYAKYVVHDSNKFEETIGAKLGKPEATMALIMKLYGTINELSDNPELQARELCTSLLALDEHMKLLKQPAQKAAKAFGEISPVLDKIVPAEVSQESKTFWWGKKKEFFTALVGIQDGALLDALQKKEMPPEILSFANEELGLIEMPLPAEGSMHFSNFAIIYPLMKVMSDEIKGYKPKEASGLKQLSNWSETIAIKNKLEKHIKEIDNAYLIPAAKSVLIERYKKAAKKVSKAYTDFLGIEMAKGHSYKTACNKLKAKVEKTTLFEDLKIETKIAYAIEETTGHGSGIFNFIDKDFNHNWEGLFKRLHAKALSNAKHTKFLRTVKTVSAQSHVNYMGEATDLFTNSWVLIATHWMKSGLMDTASLSYNIDGSATDKLDLLYKVAGFNQLDEFDNYAPQLKAALRELHNNVSQYFIFTPSLLGTKNYSSFESTYLDHVEELETLIDQQNVTASKFDELKSKLNNLRNAIYDAPYKPQVFTMMYAMSAYSGKTPDSADVTHLDTKGVLDLVEMEFDPILGGYADPVDSPQVAENPEILTYIYNESEKVGAIPQDKPSPMQMFYKAGVTDETEELLESGNDPELVQKNLFLMQFTLLRASLCEKLAQLKYQNDLNENEFGKAYEALAEMKALEADIKTGIKQLSEIAEEAKAIIDKSRILSEPIIQEVFTKDAEIKNPKLAHKFSAAHGLKKVKNELTKEMKVFLTPTNIKQDENFESVSNLAKWTYDLSWAHKDSLPIMRLPEDLDEIEVSPDKLSSEADNLQYDLMQLSIDGFVYKVLSEDKLEETSINDALDAYVKDLKQFQITHDPNYFKYSDAGPTLEIDEADKADVAIAKTWGIVAKRYEQVKTHLKETKKYRPEEEPKPDFKIERPLDDFTYIDGTVPFGLQVETGQIDDWSIFKDWLKVASKKRISENVENLKKITETMKDSTPAKKIYMKKLEKMELALEKMD